MRPSGDAQRQQRQSPQGSRKAQEMTAIPFHIWAVADQSQRNVVEYRESDFSDKALMTFCIRCLRCHPHCYNRSITVHQQFIVWKAWQLMWTTGKSIYFAIFTSNINIYLIGFMAPCNQLSGRMDIYFRPHLKTKKENRERLFFIF